LPLPLGAYLAYVFIAFDVPGLIAKSKPKRALLLATDAVAYKVHVTKFLRGTPIFRCH
jgi:phosphonate transport system permease protein